MPHLRPCPQCSRHVRSNEVRCPFCDSALAVDDRAPLVPAGRIGRAALMAFGAALATASLAGCNNKGEEPAIEAEEGAPTARPDTETRAAPAEEDRRRPQGSVAKDDGAPIQSPFLVGSEPPPSNVDTRPAETASPVVPTVNTIKKPPPPPPDITNRNHWNHAKPYGAPPADGLLEVV